MKGFRSPALEDKLYFNDLICLSFLSELVTSWTVTVTSNEQRMDREIDRVDIQNTLAGEGDAYARLVKRYEQTIASQMWKYTRDRATHRELIQDVFIEAYRGLSTFREKSPFLHWLRRIASRVGYRYWKKKAKERERFLPLQEELGNPAFVAEDLRPSEAAEYLFRLFGTLPAAERMILTLHYLEGCDMQEVAERMGWSYTLVKVRAFRARRKLKSMMIQAGYRG